MKEKQPSWSFQSKVEDGQPLDTQMRTLMSGSEACTTHFKTNAGWGSPRAQENGRKCAGWSAQGSVGGTQQRRRALIFFEVWLWGFSPGLGRQWAPRLSQEGALDWTQVD